MLLQNIIKVPAGTVNNTLSKLIINLSPLFSLFQVSVSWLAVDVQQDVFSWFYFCCWFPSFLPVFISEQTRKKIIL